MPDHHLPPTVAAYLDRRAVLGPWQLSEIPSGSFAGVIVIPSLAEGSSLPHTLQSLSKNPPEFLSQFLILIVVNHACNAAPEVIADNIATLRMLPFWKQQYGLENLHWVDAASSGCELPVKQGVGLARKIGLDLALTFLTYHDANPLLVCLDADTLVQGDYLPAIVRHFLLSKSGGASIPYRHLPAADPAGQAAIERYELFLRVYVLGLGLAGSPYAFHTVGSAMACRASAYIAAGGMNRRLAGEDFYFLQQVHKTSGVETLSGTIVHPSPRSSQRVPFGTGRSVGDILADGEQRLLFYHPDVFSIMGDWLRCVDENYGADSADLMRRSGTISPTLQDFLEQAGFEKTWENLRSNNRDGAKLKVAFHGWFDAFRTMRFIHQLSDKIYPRIAPELAVAPLLERAGQVSPANASGQLELMRSLQGADCKPAITAVFWS
jgi:hypothetical protein